MQGPARHRRQGFTLLELLVVMLLLGIVLSIAVINIGDQRHEELRFESQRLYQVIRLAHEEAILNQEVLAIRFYPHGYEFQLLVEEDWQAVNTPDYMLRHELDEVFVFELEQDGIGVSLDGEDGGRVMLSSSGEMTPFTLILKLDDDSLSYQLTGSLMGELELVKYDSFAGAG
jgi:general secretion pathway protein H